MALDLVVLGILLFSALVAFMRGFIREVLTICGLIGAAIASLYGGPAFSATTKSWIVDENAEKPQKLFDLVPYDMLATALAYLLVFVFVLVALNVAAHYISKAARAAGLGPVDRSLGVVFGLGRGVLLIGLLYLPLHVILSDEQKEEWFGNAKTLPYVVYTAELMQALLPDSDIVSIARAEDGKGESFDPLNVKGKGKDKGEKPDTETVEKEPAKDVEEMPAPKTTQAPRYND